MSFVDFLNTQNQESIKQLETVRQRIEDRGGLSFLSEILDHALEALHQARSNTIDAYPRTTLPEITHHIGMLRIAGSPLVIQLIESYVGRVEAKIVKDLLGNAHSQAFSFSMGEHAQQQLTSMLPDAQLQSPLLAQLQTLKEALSERISQHAENGDAPPTEHTHLQTLQEQWQTVSLITAAVSVLFSPAEQDNRITPCAQVMDARNALYAIGSESLNATFADLLSPTQGMQLSHQLDGLKPALQTLEKLHNLPCLSSMAQAENLAALRVTASITA